jgi:hypothetical protein
MTNREKYEQEMFELQLANAKRVGACIDRGGNPQGLHILLNPEYKAILELDWKLTEGKINHSLVRCHDGYRLVVWSRDDERPLITVTEDYLNAFRCPPDGAECMAVFIKGRRRLLDLNEAFLACMVASELDDVEKTK